MTNKKTATKSIAKSSYEPMQITFGIAALAALTLVVFALVIVVQMR
jgi:hypothetical protein